jgi:hypothetical protein
LRTHNNTAAKAAAGVSDLRVWTPHPLLERPLAAGTFAR